MYVFLPGFDYLYVDIIGCYGTSLAFLYWGIANWLVILYTGSIFSFFLLIDLYGWIGFCIFASSVCKKIGCGEVDMGSRKAPLIILLCILSSMCFLFQSLGVEADVNQTAHLYIDASEASGRPIPETLFGIFFEVILWLILMILSVFFSFYYLFQHHHYPCYYHDKNCYCHNFWLMTRNDFRKKMAMDN